MPLSGKADSIMQYLGALRGAGTLTSAGEAAGRVDYEFDCFIGPKGEVTGGGEIRMPSAELKEIFGRRGLQLLTDDGQLFSLRFTDRKLPSAADVAHVDITGNLPTISDWRH